MPTSTPPFRFRSPVCRRFFVAHHGSMPRPSRRTAGTRRGKSAQLGKGRGCVHRAESGAKKPGRKAARHSPCERDAKPYGANPGDRGPSPYDAENDLRASRTVRYWRWLMGTASSQSMTSPSAEAWTTCSIFAK